MLHTKIDQSKPYQSTKQTHTMANQIDFATLTSNTEATLRNTIDGLDDETIKNLAAQLVQPFKMAFCDWVLNHQQAMLNTSPAASPAKSTKKKPINAALSSALAHPTTQLREIFERLAKTTPITIAKDGASEKVAAGWNEKNYNLIEGQFKTFEEFEAACKTHKFTNRIQQATALLTCPPFRTEFAATL
jgi:hypothetical protein